MPVGLHVCDMCALGLGEIVNTLVRQKVKANIVMRNIRLGELVHVCTIAVHMAD